MYKTLRTWHWVRLPQGQLVLPLLWQRPRLDELFRCGNKNDLPPSCGIFDKRSLAISVSAYCSCCCCCRRLLRTTASNNNDNSHLLVARRMQHATTEPTWARANNNSNNNDCYEATPTQWQEDRKRNQSRCLRCCLRLLARAGLPGCLLGSVTVTHIRLSCCYCCCGKLPCHCMQRSAFPFLTLICDLQQPRQTQPALHSQSQLMLLLLCCCCCCCWLLDWLPDWLAD